MEVRWARKAVKDLEHIHKRIQRDNPKAARNIILTIYEGCVSLEQFPQRGRPGRMPGRRELVFPGLPYVVIYKLDNQAVEISRIWHGAQDWK